MEKTIVRDQRPIDDLLALLYGGAGDKHQDDRGHRNPCPAESGVAHGEPALPAASQQYPASVAGEITRSEPPPSFDVLSRHDVFPCPAFDEDALNALDVIVGDDADNMLIGGTWSKHDEIHGLGGNDVIYGDPSDDCAADDFIYGDDGNDILYGGGWNDRVYGGNDGDIIYGDSGYDKLYGEDGNDELYGRSEDDEAYGGSGDDVIRGDEGNDTLLGEEGDDVLEGGSGADYVDGGAGWDKVDYSRSGVGVTIDLSGASGAGGDAEGDVLVGIEEVVGTAHGDRITGSGAD
ncbi:hypothetical protein KXS07_37040, partial [Inquilinus limosus]|uniref:calcium-binding protein n=1 Tax=Inquilinus limosus TaxID=171674 RepID=UPI003F17369D